MRLLSADWVWTGRQLIAGGAVAIDTDGTVAHVGEAAAVRAAVDAAPGLEERALGRSLLMPGLVNAHSHAFQRVFRGKVQWRGEAEDSFWTWREAMYAAARSLSPEEIEAVSRLCFLEMVEAGITHVGEFHYLHRDPDGRSYDDPDELAWRVIRAARSVGLRITLLRVAYGAGGVGDGQTPAPLRPEQARFATGSPDEALASIARLRAGVDPLVSVGLAPHSVRAVPRGWLQEFAGFDGPIHAHVAEQPAEVAAARAAWGHGPLAEFAEAGLVDERFCAVHLTWPEPGDAALLRAAGARVCVCPSTELDLGDGFLPLSLREGVGLCLGSDSHARVDLFAEARALEWHARGLAGRRNVMTPPAESAAEGRHGLAARLLRSASLAGAAALGVVGRGIEPGASADLCALDLDRPAAWGVPPLEAAVFGASPEWVSDVWVQGRAVVRGGRAVAGRTSVTRLASF